MPLRSIPSIIRDHQALRAQIHDKQREQDQHCRRVHHQAGQRRAARDLQRRNQRNIRHHRGQHLHIGEKQTGIKGICPLPDKGMYKNGNHQAAPEREDDGEKRPVYAGTVHICRFVQLVGGAAVELTHQKDEQSAAKGQSRQGQHQQRHYGIHCFDRHPEHRLQYSEHVEIAELHKQRKHDRLRRDHNGEDHRRKQQSAPLKTEFGKAVSDRRADERLDHHAHQTDQKRAEKGHPVISIANDKRIIVQRWFTRNKFHRFIHQVALTEKGRGELGKQQKLDDNATPLSRIICASGHAPFEIKRFSR